MDQPQSTEVIDHQIEGLERKSLILSRAAAVILLLLSGLGLGVLLTPDLVPGVQLHVAAARAWYGLAALLGLGVLLSLLTFRQGQRWAARRLGLQGELVRRDALEKLLLIDPLTGAFNRRYLDEILVREVSRAERHGSSLTFLKIQVENLEEPAAGADYGKKERVLKAVAGLLRKNLRPTDVVVRFDENHFMVVMSQTSKHGALVAIRRLLEGADSENRVHAGQPGYPLELSYGVADHRKGFDVRDVLAAADHSVRLYQDGATPMLR